MKPCTASKSPGPDTASQTGSQCVTDTSASYSANLQSPIAGVHWHRVLNPNPDEKDFWSRCSRVECLWLARDWYDRPEWRVAPNRALTAFLEAQDANMLALLEQSIVQALP